MPDRPPLRDPIQERRALHGTESKIAIAGHPLHAMLVAFPIALAVCTLGADLLYWWTGDAFWARVAVWAAIGAFAMGLLAGITGTVELLIVPGIRIRSASWTHFILAVMLLAAGLTGVTGWHGGKLVFDYLIGTTASGSDRP